MRCYNKLRGDKSSGSPVNIRPTSHQNINKGINTTNKGINTTNKGGTKKHTMTTRTSKPSTSTNVHTAVSNDSDDDSYSDEYDDEYDDEENEPEDELTVYTDYTESSSEYQSSATSSNVETTQPKITVYIQGDTGDKETNKTESERSKATINQMLSDTISGDELEEAEMVFMREIYSDETKKAVFLAPPITPQGSSVNLTQMTATKPQSVPEISPQCEYQKLVILRNMLRQQLEFDPDNKIITTAIKHCNRQIGKVIQASRVSNVKAYYELVTADSFKTDELAYFSKQCSHAEQVRIMHELTQINNINGVDKPYRLLLLESNISLQNKSIVLQKLKMMNAMSATDSEYFKLKQWVDGFMRIPFGKYRSISVRMGKSSTEECKQFLTTARKQLDDCTYGLRDAKLQIMQLLGQWVANPEAIGSSIAIRGPMGTGKTTLVKEGISKILGREFVFVPLGGASGGSYLEGFGYTFEGSIWGKIVQTLMDAKSMNPVFYFDELDKISGTPQGDEIVNILIHLTDSSQNDEYHDKYFTELSFNLSQCIFIFSYNDESKISPILRDRMYAITTKGYSTKEKVVIARDYLLPKITQQVNFGPGDIVISDSILEEIISNPMLCKHVEGKSEQGVRNLKRCLETIYTKLNLFRLMGGECLTVDIDLKIPPPIVYDDATTRLFDFPFIVKSAHLKALIKEDEATNPSFLSMYV